MMMDPPWLQRSKDGEKDKHGAFLDLTSVHETWNMVKVILSSTASSFHFLREEMREKEREHLSTYPSPTNQLLHAFVLHRFVVALGVRKMTGRSTITAMREIDHVGAVCVCIMSLPLPKREQNKFVLFCSDSSPTPPSQTALEIKITD